MEEKFVEKILPKLTIKELGSHLANYAKFYTNPIATWKQAIVNRKSAYNYVILHLIYYSIFVF